MYPYMNKPSFMTNTSNPSFGASTSTFGQPAANTSMFTSSMQPNIFQTPNTSSFNAGPTAQTGFGKRRAPSPVEESTSSSSSVSHAEVAEYSTDSSKGTPELDDTGLTTSLELLIPELDYRASTSRERLTPEDYNRPSTSSDESTPERYNRRSTSREQLTPESDYNQPSTSREECTPERYNKPSSSRERWPVERDYYNRPSTSREKFPSEYDEYYSPSYSDQSTPLSSQFSATPSEGSTSELDYYALDSERSTPELNYSGPTTSQQSIPDHNRPGSSRRIIHDNPQRSSSSSFPKHLIPVTGSISATVQANPVFSSHSFVSNIRSYQSLGDLTVTDDVFPTSTTEDVFHISVPNYSNNDNTQEQPGSTVCEILDVVQKPEAPVANPIICNYFASSSSSSMDVSLSAEEKKEMLDDDIEMGLLSSPTTVSMTSCEELPVQPYFLAPDQLSLPSTSGLEFGTTLFGQQPQPSTSNLFGGSNAFGQNKPAFGGFGSTPAQSGLFGQQPQQPAGSSLFQSNTSNLFGSNTFGNQQINQAGTVIKFAPVTGTDTMQKAGVTQSISTKHHCITCMKEYEGKSLEELRFEDYSNNRKGPQQQPGFGAMPFGAAPTSAASTSLFGQTENKPGFGQQPTAFGQTPAFGQTTPAFGVANQPNTTNLFGKPAFGATTTASSTFGFNPTSTSNPFSATPAQKPFAQPLFGSSTTQTQPTFGTSLFGQANTQNTSTNLFQKPAQPATGFNTGTQGFSFNPTPTTQASNLFQVSKPQSGFGIFSQNNTTPSFGQNTQPVFGTNFGKLTQPTFSQPAQPTAFSTNLTGGLQQQQQPLFGAATKPVLFGNTGTGTSLFNNNVFQQPQTNFSLNMSQPQQAQFPPEMDENKSVAFVASDSFPDGVHVLGLKPVADPATNPQDIKALLDSTKKNDDKKGPQHKIRVAAPGRNSSKDFFETSQTLKGSRKCLVIRKFNENPSTIYNKYNNELLAEAEEILKTPSQADATDTTDTISTVETPRSTIDGTGDFSETLSEYKGRIMKLHFDNSSVSDGGGDTPRKNIDVTFSPITASSKISIPELKLTPSKSSISLGIEEEETIITQTEPATETETDNNEPVSNPAGVILTKPEYYMYPVQKDLHQYMDENGDCIVQGLTIGRKGYGNVHYLDPINITNMNFDEIVHFRHREVVIYPDDNTKPPVGEGLNRRAQVTLDKIFPRVKGTSAYITDLNEIAKTNFVDNLMNVTQKHNCKFVEYRPKTGSWVFKVKHFSKYGFTESDEENCEVLNDNTVVKKAQEILKKVDVEDVHYGLSGYKAPKKSVEIYEEPEIWNEETSFIEEELYRTESAIQTLKSSLFINLDKVELEEPEPEVTKKVEVRSEVIVDPKVYPLPDISLPKKIFTTQRVYTEMGIFRCNTFKVGWEKGLTLYNFNPTAEWDITYNVDRCKLPADSVGYNSMMPDSTDILKIALEETEFEFDENKVPTVTMKKSLSYLEKQTDLFNKHVRDNSLNGQEKYLSSVWNLCSALWGKDSDSPFATRQNVSNWLKRSSFDLSSDSNIDEQKTVKESQAFDTIFKLLSFHKVSEAADFASKNKLFRLGLLISQLSANERYKVWLQKTISYYVWTGNFMIDEFKKLFLLLAGIPVNDNINICEDLDWLRAFGMHLWYIAPSAAPVNVAFKSYRSSFEVEQYSTKPIPMYCSSELETTESDLLYHILALYTDKTYQLYKVLHPETHTGNSLDYRMSWFLLQLFSSLGVGLIGQSERDYLHTTFANQLEDKGLWKWAIFVLLFLENNVVKKNLIMRVLDRNIGETEDIERDLVQIFQIPSHWIHEVKATKAKANGDYYDYFQHCLHMDDYHRAYEAFVEHIIPELMINEQYEDLEMFIKKLEPHSNALVDWNKGAGLIKDYLNLNEMSKMDELPDAIGSKLITLLKRISYFPVINDSQKLCVSELSRRCALLFKLFFKDVDIVTFKAKFDDSLFSSLVMPADMKNTELYSLISRFIFNTD